MLAAPRWAGYANTRCVPVEGGGGSELRVTAERIQVTGVKTLFRCADKRCRQGGGKEGDEVEDRFPLSQRDVRGVRPFPRINASKNDHFNNLEAAGELVPGC